MAEARAVAFSADEDQSPQSRKNISRRKSEPQVKVTTDSINLSSENSGDRRPERRKTFHVASAANRRQDEVELSAESLADLHFLHETWLRKERRQTVDTSEKALKAPWKNGLWIAYGDCPTAKEKVFHGRKFTCDPPGNGAQMAFQNWQGAAMNTKGLKSLCDNTPGQDNLSVSLLPDDWQVVCVMDGHGPGGHWPATRAVRTLPFFLQDTGCANMLKSGQVEAALITAFRQTQSDLEFAAFTENVDITVAGSTAVCCCYQPKRKTVWVATAGDSRAILIEPGKGCVAQTRDHKPSVPDEKARVEKAGGEVTITVYDDGWVDERINVAGHDYPGISMTRSLGDLAVKEYGVTAEPEVVEWPLHQYKKPYIFAASDGVWEFLETDTVAAMLEDSLRKGETYLEACKNILNESRKLWQENEGDYCDDISMVFLPVQGFQKKVLAGDDCCSGIDKFCAIS